MTAPALFNPYIYGGAIKDEDRFYGRRDLVEAVINTFTTTGQNAIVLHGQRRIGKTSLLYRLQRDPTLCQGHIPIFFSLQSTPIALPARVLAALEKRVAQQLKTVAQQLSLDISVPDEASLARDEREFQRNFLPRVYPHLKNKRLLFLLDEFDLVSGTGMADLPGYFLALTEEEKEHTAFIFVIGQRLERLENEGLLRLFKGAQSQQVGRFDKDDTLNLLRELGIQGNIHYSAEALDEIWALTNGHPYVTQLIGSEIFDRLRDRETPIASLHDVENCLDDAMVHAGAGLAWFWVGFSNEAQLVLAAVAELSDRHQGAGDASVNEALRDHRLVLGPNARHSAFEQLVAGEMLLDAGKGRYQFCVEFIRRWITKYHPLKDQTMAKAEAFYQAGLTMHQLGLLDQAIDLLGKALEEAPLHFNSQLALMRALRAKGDFEGAIEEGEKAYALSPEDTRNDLIDLHYDSARILLESDPIKEEDAIRHAGRVLAIDPTNTKARKFLSDIYLKRAKTHIQESRLETARQAVQQLVEPVRIIDDEGVSKRVRQLWLDYSRELTQGESPQWVKARQTLDILETWRVTNEEVIARYNEIGLNEAHAFLEQDDLDQALDTLRTQLKPPEPIEQLKRLLIRYSRQQRETLGWEKTEKTLNGLEDVVKDEETKSELSTLYHKWGDHLRSEGQFEEAIDIYRRGRPESEFRPKITQAQQEKEDQYIRQQLDAAQAAIDQKQLPNAFDHLDRIRDKAGPRVKLLIENNLREWANHGKWADGDEALRKLKESFVDDSEVRSWYVNWLYLWAQALLKDQVTAETMAEAKVAAEAMDKAKKRCQEILSAGVDTRVLNLLGTSTFAGESADKDLRREACALHTEISLRQAQICLSQDNLTGVQTLFKEALDLPLPPENLQERIRETLRGFVQEKEAKEKWEQAKGAFTVLKELSLYDDDRKVEELFRKVTTTQARLLLKADQPAEAFEVLSRLGPEAKTELRQWGKETLYEFCWLYAGRDRGNLSDEAKKEDLWGKAKKTVDKLGEWLGPADEDQIYDLSNVARREQRESVQGKSAQSTRRAESSLAELVELVDQDWDDYKNAKKRGRDKDLHAKVEKLEDSTLDYGDALLDNNQLTEAMQSYRKLLSLDDLDKSQRANVNLKVTNALYVYSERMRREQDWKVARDALEQLKGLELPPREGKLKDQPDRRVDGAIQRVILDQARAWLKDDDKLVDTFNNLLRELPRPWPDKAVKEVIWAESKERSQQKNWKHAVQIYQRLDNFLIDDRDQVRDQEARGWLVEGLEGWGQYLAEQQDPPDQATAAEVYYGGLRRTREAADPRNEDLARGYIEAKLRLAQAELDQDDLVPEAPPQIEQAINHYQDILRLKPPEHTDEHESRLNQALYDHACKLAQAERWDRAYQILDDLDKLYHPGLKETDDTLFATWRRELFLKEISAHVQAGKVDEAITRLGDLQEWLIERNAPKASWPDSRDVVVNVGQEFYENWLKREDWEPAARFLDELARRFDGDHKVMDWEVDVLCRWGGWLQQKDNLEEAIVKYEEALAKAPQAESIERDLLNTQLMKAQKALDQDDLAAAKETYRDILKKPAEHLGRGSQIFDDLLLYSNRLAGKTPPQWTDAHAALQALSELPVDKDKVLEYRQNLTLRHMDAMLEQNAVTGAFAALGALERPWPLEGIRDIILKHAKRWVEGGTWRLATDTFKRFGDDLYDDAVARQWVVGELIKLGDLLAKEEQQNLEGADEAYRLAYTFGRESAGKKLVTTRLKRAEQALDRDDLREAANFFGTTLEVRGEHPDRANKIRNALEGYCAKVNGREPPGWDLARRALEMITSLGLQTDETQLDEADFWLKQAKIDQGFEIFDNLAPDIRSQLDLRISDIVRDHVAQYAQKGQWEPAKNIIEKLEELWPGDDKRQDWLKTASGILAAAEQAKPEPATDLIVKLREHEQTIEKQNRRIEDLEKSKRSESLWDRFRKGVG